MNKTLPPFHRGIIGFLSSKIRTTYVARGSRSLISTPFRRGPAIFFCLLFVYDVRTDTSTYVLTEKRGKLSPFKLFVGSTFPYLSRKPSANSYKCLNIFLAFVSANEAGKLEVNRHCDESPNVLFEFAVASKNLQPQSAEQIEDRILTTPRNQITVHQLADIETSIMRLESSASKRTVDKLMILFNAKFLLNHRRTRKLLKRWLATEIREYGDDSANAFLKMLEDVTDPLALGPHGYNPSFKKLNLDSIESELHALMDEFALQGVSPFLNSGTLLGYYRDGAPIPHDDDFDLGILIPGATIDEIARNWRAFLDWLIQTHPATFKGCFAATYLANGVQVDVFPAWILDGKVHVYPYCWKDADQDALLPLSTLEIRNRVFAIPSKPEDMLAINYGPNWRVPDPFWRFDYSVSRKRFSEVLKKLKS